ncbi:hypothetical protein SmJEL517_g04317 [Synchytrium microbalum]|uniref:Oxidoreductase n=1 Tax=Synchytrium microbalum TaxID=1806994 RepID=A0A507C3U6_9FUNG|nr:uncharacterized protein SmJEL517_g04317 [Synchytrium microbalum]TPX32636.1 hypothetical protein SmJEL517_g04317 [Synchytrium microbalum]
MSSSANWNFNCALITGGAGGIGLYLAKFLLQQGKKVVVAGRTESKLQQCVSENPRLSGYLVVDVGKVETLPAFVQSAISKFPEIDCVISNAGIQKIISVLRDSPADVLAAGDAEIDTNVKGTIHLLTLFLPHLLTKENSAIFTVSSGLAWVPVAFVPVYCATKAFIHSWTQSMRVQLKNKIRVIEIAPPLVETDLHRDHPDQLQDNYKKSTNPHAQSAEEFIEEFARDMNKGLDICAPGMARSLADREKATFQQDFEWMNSRAP